MNKNNILFLFFSIQPFKHNNFCTKPGRSQSLVREGRIRRGQARLKKFVKTQPGNGNYTYGTVYVAWKPATPQKP